MPTVQENVNEFDLIKQDPDILYYGTINKNGRLNYLNGNLKCLEDLDIPKNRKGQLYMQLALQMSMLNEQDEYLGNLQYSMVERDLMKMVSIPLIDKNTLVLVLDRKTDHYKVLNRLYSRLYLNSNITTNENRKRRDVGEDNFEHL